MGVGGTPRGGSCMGVALGGGTRRARSGAPAEGTAVAGVERWVGAPASPGAWRPGDLVPVRPPWRMRRRGWRSGRGQALTHHHHPGDICPGRARPQLPGWAKAPRGTALPPRSIGERAAAAREGGTPLRTPRVGDEGEGGC